MSERGTDQDGYERISVHDLAVRYERVLVENQRLLKQANKVADMLGEARREVVRLMDENEDLRDQIEAVRAVRGQLGTNR